ncbi:divIVA domain protein [Mycobacterium ulcerans str. Harvey]|uniref:DivIVA domain protein n=1 Tax=Mycobacterium ulcerans str. Harvey TaxID=1299332 RepID=A0ABN0R4C2_MYCUL|nr:divIVA domain protein [Mycobacterium ulcerans str. Harvey]
MALVLLYLVVLVLVAVVLFGVASLLFGRGEQLPPLPRATTSTVLPAYGVTRADVDAVKFTQVLRGYKTSEVDWVLDRLGVSWRNYASSSPRCTPRRPAKVRPGPKTATRRAANPRFRMEPIPRERWPAAL